MPGCLVLSGRVREVGSGGNKRVALVGWCLLVSVRAVGVWRCRGRGRWGGLYGWVVVCGVVVGGGLSCALCLCGQTRRREYTCRMRVAV